MLIDELFKNFSIIPLKGKEPFWKNWQQYCEKRTSLERLQEYDGNFGVCCGFEGLEVIDIDNHFDNADALLAWIKDNFSLSGYLIVQTGGGGYHVYYKCDNPHGNKVLAKRKFIGTSKNAILPDGKEVILSEKNSEWSTNITMVETRGKGGQVVFYDNIIQGSIDSVPKITDEKRDELFEVCYSLNEVAEKETNTTKERIKVDGQLPGDAYNNDSITIDETIKLLLEAGWTSKDNVHWWRPGKSFNEGPSATFGKVGINRFYNFSTNAHPFIDRESYSMMGVRAVLKHNGDFSKCAKELAKIYNIDVDEPSEPEKKRYKNKWRTLDDIIKDWKLKFRYNQLTTVVDVSVDKKPYDKLGLLPGDIIREMETKRGIKTISKNKLLEMINNTQTCVVYNPITEFFSHLPKWDEVDYFKELKKYITLAPDEDEQFFFSMLKKHIIRSIKCALVKKYINRMVFVLHGPQEVGKSEFFRWMLPNDELYNEEMINPNDKDSILALARYLWVNMDDLDSQSKKEVHKIKAFISHGKVTKRVAYGHNDEGFTRIVSFVGSTNKTDLLADEVNTRWIILKISDFDWEGYLKNINPLQLWSQAMHELKQDKDSGELTPDEKKIRDERNNIEFLEISTEREILNRYFERGNFPITATEIKFLIENKKYPLKMNIYALTKELKRLFGEPSKPIRENGKPGRYYYLKTDLFEPNNAFVDEYSEMVEAVEPPF